MRQPTILAVLALVLAACPMSADPSRPTPPPNEPTGTEACEAMCTNLAGLGCEEGGPVYNSDLPGKEDVPNQTCEEFCIEIQTRGVFLNPRCLATVKDCSEIEDARLRDPATCILP